MGGNSIILHFVYSLFPIFIEEKFQNLLKEVGSSIDIVIIGGIWQKQMYKERIEDNPKSYLNIITMCGNNDESGEASSRIK
jgi:hypothetical protein